MKDITKTYKVQHELGNTTITYNKAVPLHVTIDLSWKTIFLVVFVVSLIACK